MFKILSMLVIPIFFGQDTFDARGGDLTLRSGDGTTLPGNIYLEPGVNGPLSGDIIFGNLNQSSPNPVILVRATDPDGGDASSTFFIGQDSTGGDGGDLYVVGGDGHDTRGGDLLFANGHRDDGAAYGNVWWGNNDNNADLFIFRPSTQDLAGRTTTLSGQTSTGLFPGGEITFQAGASTGGGSVGIYAGDGEKADGGDIIISTSYDLTDIDTTDLTPGDIEFDAGEGFNGGNIFFFAGDSAYDNYSEFPPDYSSVGGSILIFAGTGSDPFNAVDSVLGVVGFEGGSEFILDAVPFVILGDENIPLLAIAGNNFGYFLEVTLDPTFGFFQLVTIGGGPVPFDFVLRPRVAVPGPFGLFYTPTYGNSLYQTHDPFPSVTELAIAIDQFDEGLNVLVQALEFHGLIQIIAIP